MSKFKNYAERLASDAKSNFLHLKDASRELESAEEDLKYYAAIPVRDPDKEKKYLEAKLRVTNAREEHKRINREVTDYLTSFSKTEREKLQADIDDFFAVNPEDLQPEVMELLRSDMLILRDYRKLYKAAVKDQNITMIRVIGKAIENAADKLTAGDPNREELVSMYTDSKRYNGQEILNKYDALTDIVRRCINNREMINHFEDLTAPIVKDF